LLKDTNEKKEELLKQIDEREVNIRALEDTSTSKLDDTAFLKTFLSMDQPKLHWRIRQLRRMLTTMIFQRNSTSLMGRSSNI